MFLNTWYEWGKKTTTIVRINYRLIKLNKTDNSEMLDETFKSNTLYNSCCRCSFWAKTLSGFTWKWRSDPAVWGQLLAAKTWGQVSGWSGKQPPCWRPKKRSRCQWMLHCETKNDSPGCNQQVQFLLLRLLAAQDWKHFNLLQVINTYTLKKEQVENCSHLQSDVSTDDSCYLILNEKKTCNR